MFKRIFNSLSILAAMGIRRKILHKKNNTAMKIYSIDYTIISKRTKFTKLCFLGGPLEEIF